MRALICAIAGALALTGAALAQDVPTGAPLGSPERPLPSQRWVTASDMVADCRHPASPDVETDCQAQVLLPIAYVSQNQPGVLCLPRLPEPPNPADEDRVIDDATVYPILDWIAAQPDVLKGEWKASILPAAKALWECK